MLAVLIKHQNSHRRWKFIKKLIRSSSAMQPGAPHDAVKPLLWLLGTWRSDNGCGIYPTLKTFYYHEMLTFTTLGQPVINYTAQSWHPTEKHPMHLESGYLKINPFTGRVSFLLAHNFGVTTIEEGCVTNDDAGEQELELEGNTIGRMSFSKPPFVLRTKRTWRILDVDKLEAVFLMETERTPLTPHLSATYRKTAGFCPCPD